MLCIAMDFTPTFRECCTLKGKKFLNIVLNDSVVCIDIIPNTTMLPRACKLDLVIKYKFPSDESNWHCTCDCVNTIKPKKCIYHVNKKYIGIKG